MPTSEEKPLRTVDITPNLKMFLPSGMIGPPKEELYWRYIHQVEEVTFYAVQAVFQLIYAKTQCSPAYLFLCEEDYRLLLRNCRGYDVRRYTYGDLVMEGLRGELVSLINTINGRYVALGTLPSLTEKELLLWLALP